MSGMPMDWGEQPDSAISALDGAGRGAAHGPLKARAYDALVLDIIVGDFPSSGRLDEAALAKKHGVGLAGVRDALNRLSLEGLVLRQPRFGTLVAPIQLHEVQQALEARMLLEPYVARLAAQQAGGGQAPRMKTAVEAAAAGVLRGDYRTVAENGRCFYRALGEAGGNVYLLRSLLILYTFAARVWVRSLPHRGRDEQLGDIARLAELTTAIERGDAVGADRIVGTIIAALRQGVHRSLAAGGTLPS